MKQELYDACKEWEYLALDVDKFGKGLTNEERLRELQQKIHTLAPEREWFWTFIRWRNQWIKGATADEIVI